MWAPYQEPLKSTIKTVINHCLQILTMDLVLVHAVTFFGPDLQLFIWYTMLHILYVDSSPSFKGRRLFFPSFGEVSQKGHLGP